MRIGITVTGAVVLVLGLIVAGAGFAYADITTQWVGGVVAFIGLVAGIAGAAMKSTAAKLVG